MGEGPEASGREAVVIATNVDLIESLVVSAGYDVVGAAETAVNGESLLAHLCRRNRAPDAVIVENDLVGPTGWDSIPDLRAASPTTQVLLVVNEDWTPRGLASSGAFAVVTRSRLSELVNELDDVDRWIADQATAAISDDRRHGGDRRVHQDWNKVGWERRVEQRRAA
jgi:DNA-binding NarL/FixJ family response regulator